MVGTILYTPLALSPDGSRSPGSLGEGEREPGNDCMRMCKPYQQNIVSEFLTKWPFERIKIDI